MKPRSISLLVLVVACAGLLAVMLARAQRISAEAAHRAAAGQRALVAQQVARLVAARADDADDQLPIGRPDANMADGLQVAMRTVGVPERHLRGVTAVADEQHHPDQPIRVTRYRLDLVELTLPKLGHLLAAWQQAEPVWRVVSLQIDVHDPTTAGTAGASASRQRRQLDQPTLSATLIVAARYLPLAATEAP